MNSHEGGIDIISLCDYSAMVRPLFDWSSEDEKLLSA
jgi:hypothetical protein